LTKAKIYENIRVVLHYLGIKVNKTSFFIWNIIDTLADFKNFLVHPRFEKSKPTVGGFIGIILVFVCSFILEQVYLNVLYSYFPAIETSYTFNDTSELGVEEILDYTVIGVILEELYFRSWMTKNKHHALLLVASAISFGLNFFTASLLNATETSQIIDELVAFSNLAISWSLGKIAIGDYLKKFSDFVQDRSRVLFYFSCICFALMHVGNYDTDLSKDLVLAAQLPLFIFAVVAGYTRIRYGLLCSVLLHAANNAFMILIH
jgi:membrane protease YdiL (CAAX protease family)